MMPTIVSEAETTRSLLRSLNICIPWTQTLSLCLNTSINPTITSNLKEYREGEAMQVHAPQRQAQKKRKYFKLSISSYSVEKDTRAKSKGFKMRVQQIRFNVCCSTESDAHSHTTDTRSIVYNHCHDILKYKKMWDFSLFVILVLP